MLRKPSRAFKIALAAIIAAVYVAMVLLLQPISYGPLQFRLATIVAGATPVFGAPAIAGFLIGQFISNTMSPLGPIDLLSPLAAAIGLTCTYYLRKKSVMLGLTILSVILALWVATMLMIVFGVPWLITFSYLVPGIWAPTALLGYILYKVLRRYYPEEVETT